MGNSEQVISNYSHWMFISVRWGLGQKTTCSITAAQCTNLESIYTYGLLKCFSYRAPLSQRATSSTTENIRLTKQMGKKYNSYVSYEVMSNRLKVLIYLKNNKVRGKVTDLIFCRYVTVLMFSHSNRRYIIYPSGLLGNVSQDCFCM